MTVLKLKEFRKKFRMSQRDVAFAINMSQQGYCRWENGSAFPNGEKILELCELFNCTPNDLFGFKGVHTVLMDELDSK